MWYLTSKETLNNRFLPYFGPFSLLGLLYTIVVMFAYQGRHIIDNIGNVFRVFVPMTLYFFVMWTFTFGSVLWFHNRRSRSQIGETKGGDDPEELDWGYEMAVTQAFTAGSNNFVRYWSGFSVRRSWKAHTFVSGACHCHCNRCVWG